METLEHQSFPLGWQALAEERKRFFSGYFECQVKKKPACELMQILRKMILPKNTIVSAGGFWQTWQISAAPSDCMKFCVSDLTFLILPFGVQSLSLLPSAFKSFVDSIPDAHCYSVLCFQCYSSKITSLSKHWLSLPWRTVCWSLGCIWIFLVSLLLLAGQGLPALKCLTEKCSQYYVYLLQ